jgi:hypothetical protein
LPFRSDSDYELMRQHISEPPAPPTSLSAAVPKGIEQCVMKALAKDAAMRFQSAEKFGAALEYPNGVPEAMLLEGAVLNPAPDPVPVPKPVPPPPPLTPGPDLHQARGQRQNPDRNRSRSLFHLRRGEN